MHIEGYPRGTEDVEGVTVRAMDLEPRLGETQRLSSTADGPPPFYDWGPPFPAGLTSKQGKNEKSRPASNGRVSSGESGGYEPDTW